MRDFNSYFLFCACVCNITNVNDNLILRTQIPESLYGGEGGLEAPSQTRDFLYSASFA